MGFDDLKNIQEHELVIRPAGLEEIIECGERLQRDHVENYNKICELAESLHVTPTLLQQYIWAYLRENNFPIPDKEAFIRGQYTGALLEKLAQQNTVVLIDCKNKVFSHLFRNAAETPLTIIKNVIGNDICTNITNARVTFVDVIGSRIATNAHGYSTLVRIRGSKLRSLGPGDVSVLAYKGRWGGGNGKHIRGRIYHDNTDKVVLYPEKRKEKFSGSDEVILSLLRQCDEDPIEASRQLHDIAWRYL
jgi:hypothetical protein